jgi:hypothetical protein
MRVSAKVFAGVVAVGLAVTLSSCSTSSGGSVDTGTGARSSSSAAAGNDFSSAKSLADSYLQDVKNADLVKLAQATDDDDAAKLLKDTTKNAEWRIDDKSQVASWDITGLEQDTDGTSVLSVAVTNKAKDTDTVELNVNTSDASDNLKRPYLVDNALPKIVATDYIENDLDAYGDDEYDIVDHNTKIYLINKAGVKKLYTEGDWLLPGTYKLEIMTDISEQHDDPATDKSTFKKLASLDKTFTKDLTLRG